MSASKELEGKTLQGKRNGQNWTVVRQLHVKAGDTPGAFSVGYEVVSEDGRQGFLKASDLSMFSGMDISIADAFNRVTTAHVFERDVLEHCQSNAMDRIVTAIDYGEYAVQFDGALTVVFFLIFELAKGDIRENILRANRQTLFFCSTVLHNAFVATNQLHKANIAHNDLKPPNVLIWDEELQKVADLGRASSEKHPASHDGYLCAGDTRYAPPEQLYPDGNHSIHLNNLLRRKVGDLYNLGSLIFFVLTGRMLTPEVIANLRPEMRPKNESGGSRGDLTEAIPYWEAAIIECLAPAEHIAVDRFGPGVANEVKALSRMVKELTAPDMKIRGHPLNRIGAANAYGLERYISELDSLKAKLRVKAA